MATERPRISKTPLEALENEGIFEQPLLSKYYAPIATAALGFGAVIFANYATKKPLMSSIQLHAAATGIGAWIGYKIEEIRTAHFADRDAIFRHYVRLHPEDFPPYESKKIGDLLENWMPIR